MKIGAFPYIAAGVGVLFMLLVIKGSETGDAGTTQIPLLTLLIVSEFAFFVTGFGAFIGFKHLRTTGIRPVYLVVCIICILLAVSFMWLGIKLWPL